MSTVVPKAGRPQKNIILQIVQTLAQADDGGDVTAFDKRFETQVSNVNLAPGNSPITWQGGVPDAKLVDPGITTWVANVTAIQAWDDVNSFVNWCFNNQGEQASLTYFPHADTAVGFKVNFTVPAPTIGGAVNAFNESTTAIPCDAPVKVLAIPSAT